MSKSVTIVFAIIASIGFALGLTAHIAAILRSPVALLGGAWWMLHFTSMLVLFAAMLFSRRYKSATNGERWPRWVKAIYVCVLVYVVGNLLVIELSHTPEGRLERRENGSWTIMNGNRLVREISEQEALDFRVRSVRAKSGIWILFHGMSAVWLFSSVGAMRRNTNPIDEPTLIGE